VRVISLFFERASASRTRPNRIKRRIRRDALKRHRAMTRQTRGGIACDG
jgi:hypothetical protein